MYKVFMNLLDKILLAVLLIFAGMNSYAAEFELFEVVKHKPALTAPLQSLSQPSRVGESYLDSNNQQSSSPQIRIGTAIQTSAQLKTIAVGDVLTFGIYRIIIDRTKEHSNGDVSLIGYTDNGHSAIITRGSDGSSGIIRTNDGIYKIQQDALGERIISPDDLTNMIKAPIDDGGIVPDRSNIKKKFKKL